MIGAKIEKCAGNLEATKMEIGIIQNDRRRISTDGLCYLFLIFLTGCLVGWTYTNS